jgi:hypothetical protein
MGTGKTLFPKVFFGFRDVGSLTAHCLNETKLGRDMQGYELQPFTQQCWWTVTLTANRDLQRPPACIRFNIKRTGFLHQPALAWTVLVELHADIQITEICVLVIGMSFTICPQGMRDLCPYSRLLRYYERILMLSTAPYPFEFGEEKEKGRVAARAA